MDGGMSPDERRSLRQARLVIYLAPMTAGLLSATVLVGAERFGRVDPGGVFPVICGNLLLGAAGAAFGVVRLHPVQRGRWGRAAAAFLFALPTGLISMVGFGMVAGLIGLLR